MSRLLLALALALPVACRDKNSEAIERWEAVDVRSAVAESIRAIAEANGCRTCAMDGRCTYRDGACFAGDDADCAQSFGCRAEGRCNEVRNICVADKQH